MEQTEIMAEHTSSSHAGQQGGGAFLVTTLTIRDRERTVYAFYENDHAAELSCLPAGGESILGNIYVGKVKNIAANISAAFIEIANGQLCYYALNDNDAPIFTTPKKKNTLVAGDELLVQVSREAVKTKAPTVTANLNFAGKYLVLTSGKHHLGLSSKLSPEDKQRLRTIAEPFLGKDFGIIVRTNAAEASEDELRAELGELTEAYRYTVETGRNRACFSLVYKEPSAYAARLRGLRADSFNKIVTDRADIYRELKAYLTDRQPADLPKLYFYEETAPSLDSVYGLSKAFEEAGKERVWLKSGGYLVIQPTEALTVVDINTGKYTGKKKKDDTFLKINLEAARELARQLRLRNLSGIIVADFIDMDREEDKQTLMAVLASELKKDPVRTSLVDMTPLGLVEITRKKVQKTLAEQVNS
ncbi:ribonuclease E/G [Laedolimicola intestinihominis]|uniref:Ribonuclease E/G n=1 Tax=Laedolimicola intestinihominis TaxID=3133166 RepID=A0ABV1FJU5_9FIRM